MRLIITIVLAVSMGLVNDIAKINKHKSEAQKFYLSGDYENALQHYQILVDSFKVEEESVIMNYANSAYLLTYSGEGEMRGLENQKEAGSDIGDKKEGAYLKTALNHYNKLATQAQDNVRSLAYNQLGVMAFQSGGDQPDKNVLQQAQVMFKGALRANPSNDDARYNYELVTNMLKQQEEQEQDQDQNQEDQEKQDQEKQEQEQQDQEQQKNEQEQQSGEDQEEQDQSGEDQNEDSQQKEGDPKDSDEENAEEKESQEQEPPSNPTQIEEMKISEEKAKMILEAMKNAEVQYIQQNKRKATKRPENGKPDW